MSTGASQQGIGGGPDEVSPGRPDTNGVPPLADDRPYVDGTAASAEELRAEVERLSNEDRQHVDDLREEVGDSLAELKARLDVKARVAERKDEAVAAVHRHVDRARHVAVDRTASAKDTAAEKPGLVAGIAAALLVLLLVVLRRRRRR
jgi:MYXO-CTERM domain-containing protein